MAGQHRVTEEILKKTLGNKHEAHPKDVTLKDFTVSAGSNTGDGYTCELKKISVTSEIRDKTEKDTIMFKCVPVGDAMLQYMKQAHVFRTETTFYLDIVPKLNKIARQYTIGNIATPEAYYGDEDEGVLAMQDLKQAGFGLKGRHVGLSVPDMKLFLRELAKLHGLSHHFVESYFGGFERFKKDYWYMSYASWLSPENKKADQLIDQMIKINFSLAVMVLEESPEHKDLLKPLKEFANDRFWKVKHDIHAPKGPFNCLLHNDSWCNNAMFKDSSDGSAQDIRLIDFQGVRYGRPTGDLVYCLVSSMAPDVRKAHLDELLQFYHTELLIVLKKIGYSDDVYTFEQLKADYFDSFPHGFSMGLIHGMGQGTDPTAEGNFDFQKMLSEDPEAGMSKMNDFLREHATTNEEVRQKVIKLVQEARDMKIL